MTKLGLRHSNMDRMVAFGYRGGNFGLLGKYIETIVLKMLILFNNY